MADALNPKGPSQPNIGIAYNTPGNPVDHSRQEQAEASSKAHRNNGSAHERREQGDLPVPSQHHESATPTAMAQGVRDSSGDKGEAMGKPASNLEGEQMAMSGEGEVYNKQFNKDGFGEQGDLASDLDRKKQEQAGAREEIKQWRQENVDVGGALGQRLGPVTEGR